jgi:transposase
MPDASQMIRQGSGGRIINISYVHEDWPMPGNTPYCLSKGGMAISSGRAMRPSKGFVVLPRRWVVERTFSWFGRNRPLAKDFENLAETLATFVTVASIQLAFGRLVRE